MTAGQAGDRISCPACGAELVIPRLGELSTLEAAAEEQRSGRRWTVGHACGLAGLLIAAAAASGAVGLRAWAVGEPVTDEETTRAAVAASDIGTVHRGWISMARSGIERPPLPEEARSHQLYRSADALARLLWAIAAGGAVLAVAGITLHRPASAGSAGGR